MRLLHGADFHIGLTRYGSATGGPYNSRVRDQIATLNRFVDAGLDHKADVLVLAGDTFTTRHEGPWVRAEFVKAITRFPRRKIVLPGNHDGMGTVGDADTHSLRWLREARIPLVTVPLYPMVDENMFDYLLTAYPYPHKRAFDERLAHLDPDDRVLEAGRILDSYIAEVPSLPNPDGLPRLFVGHLTVGGSTTGTEATMAFTWDVAVSPHVLEGYDYAALGHIHRQQQVPGSTKAWYSGSPEYIDFGEVDDQKGFLLVDIEPGQEPVVRNIPSGARRMIRDHFEQTGDGLYALTPTPARVEIDWDAGPIVQLEFHPSGADPDAQSIARIERNFRALGASFIKTVVHRKEAPPAERIAVEDDLDIATATRRWLIANGHPEEPTMTAARQLIAGGTT